LLYYLSPMELEPFKCFKCSIAFCIRALVGIEDLKQFILIIMTSLVPVLKLH